MSWRWSMSIRPVDLSIIQRTSDVSQVKQQLDVKPVIEQQNIQDQMVKKEERLAHQVIETEDAPKTDTHADAREESKNKYKYVVKKKKIRIQQNDILPADKVTRKKAGGDFDIKI